MIGERQLSRGLGAQWLRLALALLVGVLLFVGTMMVAGAADKLVPTITIVSVDADTTVTVRTANFPANRVFDVRFGPMGTQGVNGAYAGSFNSGPGGELVVRIEIPAAFAGDDRIAIRLESGGYYSYNWFYNADFAEASSIQAEQLAAPTPTSSSTSSGTSGGSSTVLGSGFYIEVSLPSSSSEQQLAAPTPTAEPSTLAAPAPETEKDEATKPLTPTITFLAVSKGISVTIVTENFPPSRTFTATMSRTVTLGIDGIEVGTLDSGLGGSLTATYLIPAELVDEYAIAIRLESPDGFFSYAWFYNQDYSQQTSK